MPTQKNPGARPQKQDKSPPETPREPMRKPEEGGEEVQRDRTSNAEKGDGDSSGSVISNDEEVEVDDGAAIEDDESNKVTGRHPSQRDQ